jgi:hypothetical protein
MPRKKGPDLFSIAGYTIPEHLTRYASGFYSPEDDAEEEDEEAYEKVDHDFATVNDLYDDATIKLRKAAQSSAAAKKCPPRVATPEIHAHQRHAVNLHALDVRKPRP